MSRGSRIFSVVLVAMVAAGIWGTVRMIESVAGLALPEPVESGQSVEFVISAGQSGQSIANSLNDQGVVDAGAFLDEVTERGIAERLAPGSYQLETGMPVDAVADVLEAGPQLLRVTIPEGLRVDQTLVRLEEQTPWSVQDYRNILENELHDRSTSELELPAWVPAAQLPDEMRGFEGLLWPATYDFELDVEPTAVLQRLLDQTSAEMQAVPAAERRRARRRWGLTPYEALKIASLIEREAKVAQDRPLISAVIRNRLDDGMLLQIDASTEYQGAMNLPGDSGFDLYDSNGLPPTPISGARSTALQVAFSPPRTVSFLFYVVDDACDGSHVFADTFAEHEVNVAAYRAVGECE